MTLLRLDASIRVEGSHSRANADIVEQEWLREETDRLARQRGRELAVATSATSAWAA
jgi:FMN-dependent NADH-azoreductase